jgi:hypothetical protein
LVSGLLVSGRFRFWVVSDQVESVIKSSSVRSFQISGRIRSDQVGSSRLSGHLVSGYFGFRVLRLDQVGYRVI